MKHTSKRSTVITTQLKISSLIYMCIHIYGYIFNSSAKLKTFATELTYDVSVSVFSFAT